MNAFIISIITFFIGFLLGKISKTYEKKILNEEYDSYDDHKLPDIKILVYNKGKSTERQQQYLTFDTISQLHNFNDFQEFDMSSVKQCPGSLFLYVNGEMKEYKNSNETQKFL